MRWAKDMKPITWLDMNLFCHPIGLLHVLRVLFFLPFHYLSNQHYKNKKFVGRTSYMKIQDFKRRLLKYLLK
jgi:hypothetical protein